MRLMHSVFWAKIPTVVFFQDSTIIRKIDKSGFKYWHLSHYLQQYALEYLAICIQEGLCITPLNICEHT